MKLAIKPLSVNAAWKGRRFKTDRYKSFELEVLYTLPRLKLPEPPFKLSLVFGFTNYASDIDNPCKMFVDCLSKKYGFNDKHIVELNVKKELVKAGQEFICFNIESAMSEASIKKI